MAFVNISAASVDAHKDTCEVDEQRKVVQETTKLNTDLFLTGLDTTYKKCYDKYDCSDKWWKKTVIYEVYIRSFYDSNNDGIGDLKGVESKLDYFKYLGVDTLWLTPMYPSPMVDFGYDISDFNGIDPMFGMMDDFKRLLRSMKDKDMKLILDFVPNHTSDQHEWFKMSILQQEPYANYYVWKSPVEYDNNGQPVPPNNWKSVFGGSAWSYNESRKQFYLHQFAKEQPDLNFRNPLVIQEMINIIKFWLELGVDGFRLDAAPHILEDEQFRDNPPAGNNHTNSEYTEDDYCFWDHQFTCDCPGVLDILTTFRSVCDEWSVKDGNERVLLTEGYLPLPDLVKYYGTIENPVAHFSFNFELGLSKDCTGTQVFTCITRWLDALPEHCWPNWQTGNHDQPRIASKLGQDMVDIMNMILLLLPGTAITYYGEEIGMQNTTISWEQTKDPAGRNAGPSRFTLFSRDPERSPMQWDPNSSSSGFSDSATPWLPVNNDYLEVNVKSETETEKSHLKTYTRLMSLRKSAAWQRGHLDIRLLCDSSVLAFTRIDKLSGEGILTVSNFSDKTTHVNCKMFEFVPMKENGLTVFVVTSLLDKYNEGSNACGSDIVLNGRSGLACKFIVSTND